MSAEQRGARRLTLTLPDEVLQVAAERVVEVLLERTQAPAEAASPWLDFEGAIEYLDFFPRDLLRGLLVVGRRAGARSGGRFGGASLLGSRWLDLGGGLGSEARSCSEATIVDAERPRM
ncbi:MAG: hypothetical protein ACRDM0_15180 [Thermoleophilaceae bacterium]|jgi:hypothetical protein